MRTDGTLAKDSCGLADAPRPRRAPINNNDPRCVEVATKVPGKVAVRNSENGCAVEFTAVEWTDFLTGTKLGEFHVVA
ncbi:DUF397 domain-containing protein [Streptomyces sp. NPDC087850]|uniref:DUF397 domain-containing protein n=1 Tax=Streptomyces sp. NPDC087850 TaxID=3365809 RepID=UPI0038144187